MQLAIHHLQIVEDPSVSAGRVSSIAGNWAAVMISGAPPPANEKSNTVTYLHAETTTVNT